VYRFGTPHAFNFSVTTALILLLGIGVAEAANPTLLAETGGFVLSNAHRCGVAIERSAPIVAAARDSSAAAIADSRFAEIFLASALSNQDPDAFPSCAAVIEQFDRLERHHEQVGRNRGTRTELGLLSRESRSSWRHP
jgi:hypothetical protein